MQKRTDSYTFGKEPKTMQKAFSDMLKKRKKGIEKNDKRITNKEIKP